MNMKRLVQIAIVAALVWAAPVQATLQYTCDFETEAARARWKLNPTVKQSIADQILNKWYLGAPGQNGKNGSFGLYISDDNGLICISSILSSKVAEFYRNNTYSGKHYFVPSSSTIR